MEKISRLSYAVRRTQPSVCASFPCSESEIIFTTEQIEENGRIMHSQVSKTQDPRKKFEGLRVNDFCLENVMASGAQNLLTPQMLHGSSLVSADAISSQLEMLNSIDLQSSVSNSEISQQA